MPSPIAPFLALSLAFAGLTSQSAPDDPIVETRSRLEGQRRELLANIADAAWMRDSARATLVRLAVERNWKACAANEATALAKASERPARLLAEAALAKCRPWEQALVSALRNGADPYVNGLVSREDMVAEMQLQSRDAALARIFLWRGVPGESARGAPAAARSVQRDPVAGSPAILLQPAFPRAPAREPTATARPDDANEAEIVVVAQRRNRCRVRLADRMLSESDLAVKAKQWAAAGTALRVIQPPGANYGCLAKIARHLGQYGVHLLQFVDP